MLIKDQREAILLANDYEKTTNKQFPRFASKAYKEADMWAAGRSKAGGASKSFLARDFKEEQAKTAKTFKEAL